MRPHSGTGAGSDGSDDTGGGTAIGAMVVLLRAARRNEEAVVARVVKLRMRTACRQKKLLEVVDPV